MSQASAETKRLFFAVELSDDAREAVDDIAERLRKASVFTACKPVWVPAQNLHVTLYFLGEVSQKVADNLVEMMPEAAAGFGHFDIDLRHLGYFPTDGREPPKVLWVGIHNPPADLGRLRAACASLIARAGLPVPEQAFSPHITLARFKSTKGLAAFRSMAKTYQFVKLGTSPVLRLTLMESVTGDGQAMYRPYSRAEFPHAAET